MFFVAGKSEENAVERELKWKNLVRPSSPALKIYDKLIYLNLFMFVVIIISRFARGEQPSRGRGLRSQYVST